MDSNRRKPREIKKFKRKLWLARKTERRREANREDRRQKFLNKHVKQTELEAKALHKSSKVEVSTQVNFVAVDEAIAIKPSNADVQASISRGHVMIEAARNMNVQKGLTIKLRPSIEDQKRKFRAVGTNRKDVVIAPPVKLRKRETSKLKELEPDLISRITEVRALGQGTFGLCFLAKYRNIIVAVKRYLDNDGKKSLSSLQKSAKQEASVLLELGDHKGLPFLFGVCTQAKPIQIVLLYHGDGLTNLTIYQATKSKPELSVDTWCSIFRLTAEALQYVHACGYIHNDIKSNNVVLEKFNSNSQDEVLYNPVVIDFGCSVKESLAKPPIPKAVHLQRANKDSYIAPELLTGSRPPSCSSDVYSFAKMVVFVSSRCPFEVPSLISQCLLKNPDERPSLVDVIACFSPGI